MALFSSLPVLKIVKRKILALATRLNNIRKYIINKKTQMKTSAVTQFAKKKKKVYKNILDLRI